MDFMAPRDIHRFKAFIESAVKDSGVVDTFLRFSWSPSVASDTGCCCHRPGFLHDIPGSGLVTCESCLQRSRCQSSQICDTKAVPKPDLLSVVHSRDGVKGSPRHELPGPMCHLQLPSSFTSQTEQNSERLKSCSLRSKADVSARSGHGLLVAVELFHICVPGELLKATAGARSCHVSPEVRLESGPTSLESRRLPRSPGVEGKPNKKLPHTGREQSISDGIQLGHRVS